MHAYLVLNDTSASHALVTDHLLPAHPRLIADTWKRLVHALNRVLPAVALIDPYGAGQYWGLGIDGRTLGDAIGGPWGWAPPQDETS